jgi:hypothetical protein
MGLGKPIAHFVIQYTSTVTNRPQLIDPNPRIASAGSGLPIFGTDFQFAVALA